MVFKYSDYRIYLQHEFSSTGPRRGRRGALAESLQCQTSFLSQVITGKTHLSMEHAIKVAEFLELSSEERDYFLLLVQKGKAGSKPLFHYFDQKAKAMLVAREEIRERLQIKTVLSTEDQMMYYSSWYYVAIHILCALPGLNQPESISAKLNLDMQTVKKALEFLVNRGFVKTTPNGYAIQKEQIHLARGSPMLPRHHSNWRMKAIEALDREKASSLHYSVLLGISKSDQLILKERLLTLLEEFEPIIRKSKEEIPVVFNLDFFRL